ncbi:unnamed protein product [Meganyctiphanes norvegica]|uniref:DNA topoisomerase I n=1 Tax=Meganyctiphanes norvegica TaxID=48144 RepID=A0AAV2SWL1_MEGNR
MTDSSLKSTPKNSNVEAVYEDYGTIHCSYKIKEKNYDKEQKLDVFYSPSDANTNEIVNSNKRENLLNKVSKSTQPSEETIFIYKGCSPVPSKKILSESKTNNKNSKKFVKRCDNPGLNDDEKERNNEKSKEIHSSIPINNELGVTKTNVRKCWEGEKSDNGVKWTFLSHNGPVFADPYVQLPNHVKFLYKGEPMKLTEKAEEVAGFYAKMLEHDCTKNEVFNNNFFTDWRKQMTQEEKQKIKKLINCDFRQVHAYYVDQYVNRKTCTKEEKKALKDKEQQLIEKYGWCMVDGLKKYIGNFKIEPPGLFKDQGKHPKQGLLKLRIEAEDVSINCSKDSEVPEPPLGHKWRSVHHDNTVTWLACWTENVQGITKYVRVNADSKLKGEKEWQKYESARSLHQSVDEIRKKYRADWKNINMRTRQCSVAIYFIDKFDLRVGNEKYENQAGTVGCCSLQVEHIKLVKEKDGKKYVVVFDFMDKDSIQYYNEVQVDKIVFRNLQYFMQNKIEGEDLFDKIDTASMNKYLNELMEGLTAKVFHTYKASRTLQEQLQKLTDPNDSVPAKIFSYNRAKRNVAIFCNHQLSTHKSFDKGMENLKFKIKNKGDQFEDAERQLQDAEKDANGKKKKALDLIKAHLSTLELYATIKEENKTTAVGTSVLNFLDPRISVAWAKRNGVPLEKVYNKNQLSKYEWAIDMAMADYNFMDDPTTMPGKSANTSHSQNEDERKYINCNNCELLLEISGTGDNITDENSPRNSKLLLETRATGITITEENSPDNSGLLLETRATGDTITEGNSSGNSGLLETSDNGDTITGKNSPYNGGLMLETNDTGDKFTDESSPGKCDFLLKTNDTGNKIMDDRFLLETSDFGDNTTDEISSDNIGLFEIHAAGNKTINESIITSKRKLLIEIRDFGNSNTEETEEYIYDSKKLENCSHKISHSIDFKDFFHGNENYSSDSEISCSDGAEEDELTYCSGCGNDNGHETVSAWIDCKFCGCWWHKHCTKVSENLAHSENEENDWYCPKCVKAIGNTYLLITNWDKSGKIQMEIEENVPEASESFSMPENIENISKILVEVPAIDYIMSSSTMCVSSESSSGNIKKSEPAQTIQKNITKQKKICDTFPGNKINRQITDNTELKTVHHEKQQKKNRHENVKKRKR